MIYGLVLAAGKGSRYGKEKQKEVLNGKPLYEYSLEVFNRAGCFDRILLAEPENGMLKTAFEPVIRIKGGAERSDSVCNALNFIRSVSEISQEDLFIIHDSARPLIKIEYLTLILEKLKDYPAVTLGYPVTDALKLTDGSGEVSAEVDRKNLFAVVTPQGYRLKKLSDYMAGNSGILYDESSLFTANGEKVFIVNAGRYNLKVTYPEDLEAVKKLLP